MAGTPTGVEKLAPELDAIDAMLGNLAVCQKNYRYIEVVTFEQCGVGIDIDLAQSSAKFREHGRDLQLCLVT